jgi:hypothetical protein
MHKALVPFLFACVFCFGSSVTQSRSSSPVYLYQYRSLEGQWLENNLPPNVMSKRGYRLIRVRVGFFRGVAPARLQHIIQSSEVRSLIKYWAAHYQVDPKLIQSVIEVESGFTVSARSHKGAGGLMQLMPKTAERFDVIDVFDPSENIRGGTAYLRWLLDHFDQDLTKAIAAYNAGEGAVEKHRGIPPFQETRRYVPEVLRRYQETDFDVVEPTRGVIAQLKQEGAGLFRPKLKSSEALNDSVPRSIIYQWEDEKGRLRLSDIAPTGLVKNLIQYGEK